MPRSNKVEYLPIVTRLDINPDQVIESALGRLKDVVIVGYDKDGQEYFASSIADGGTANWLLDRCKLQLLNMTEDDI